MIGIASVAEGPRSEPFGFMGSFLHPKTVKFSFLQIASRCFLHTFCSFLFLGRNIFPTA